MPCDQSCLHPASFLALETLEQLFRTKMPLPMGLCDLPCVETAIARETEAMEALERSQKELESKLSAMEGELHTLKSRIRAHPVISAEALIAALYPEPCFEGRLRLISILPKVLLRFKDYKVVLELAGCRLAEKASWQVQAFSSQLPVKTLEAALSYRVMQRQVAQERETIELRVQFHFTTKFFPFGNFCLLVSVCSPQVQPLVLEGLIVRARKTKA